MKRLWSKKQVIGLFARYRQGETFQEIGASFGIKGEQIRRLFQRDGLDHRSFKKSRTSKYTGWSREKVLEMFEFYRSGHTMDETAEHYKLSRNKVRELFVREQLDHRKFSKKTMPREPVREREEILKMFGLYKKGRTMESVGKSFGISRRRVQQLFVEAGLDYRKFRKSKAESTKPVSKSRARKMFNLYRAGMVLDDLAKLYGTSRKTITQMFVAMGYDYRRYKKSRTARTKPNKQLAPKKRLDSAEVSRLYVEEKLSVRKIAILSGATVNTVTRHLQKSGVLIEDRGRATVAAVTFYPELTEKELRRMISEENLTPAQIAAKTRCSVSTVYYRLNKFGIIFRKEPGENNVE